jgi:hypothetical protein
MTALKLERFWNTKYYNLIHKIKAMFLEPPAGLGYEIYVPLSRVQNKEILNPLHVVAFPIQYELECCNTECNFLISNRR